MLVDHETAQCRRHFTHLYGKVAAVDIVPEKEIACSGRVAADLAGDMAMQVRRYKGK